MNGPDSVSVFAEGTFEEQIRELVTYIARSRPETDRAAFLAPFEEELKIPEGENVPEKDEIKRKAIVKKVVDVIQGTGEGSDREAEGFFNLLFSHLSSLYPSDSPDLSKQVESLLKAILASSTHQPPVKARILTNSFNATPRRSAIRLSICTALVQLAKNSKQMTILNLSPSGVEKWLSEWNVTDEQKATFLKTISDAYASVGQSDVAYAYTLTYVRSMPPESSSAQAAAQDAVIAALNSPSIFNFDPLLQFQAVQKLSPELSNCLKVFTGGDYADYTNWLQDNKPALQKFGLDEQQLERKVRLLSLASLGSTSVGRDVPYAKVGAALHVDPSEVEKWVIDVLRAGLLRGKLSQSSQTLHVLWASPRSFGPSQWANLESRLLAWKTGLTGVLEVVTSARHEGTINGSVLERPLHAQSQVA